MADASCGRPFRWRLAACVFFLPRHCFLEAVLPVIGMAHLMRHCDDMHGLQLLNDLDDDPIGETFAKNSTVWVLDNPIMQRRFLSFLDALVNFGTKSFRKEINLTKSAC
ncbi:MAG: hypothetical protein NTW21_39075 [Verrucomicrobia bacterium]|nr:hypothetical protein [Verrucomicrobiota bacterium]